jgi:hypothetical protein
MKDPDVYVVLKDGDSHGERDGTPLCVDLSEQMARYHKIGRCVRYVPADQVVVKEESVKITLQAKVVSLGPVEVGGADWVRVKLGGADCQAHVPGSVADPKSPNSKEVKGELALLLKPIEAQKLAWGQKVTITVEIGEEQE